MGGGSGRHAELAGELVEWWEDLWQAHTGSRVVLVAVPPGGAAAQSWTVRGSGSRRRMMRRSL